MNLSLTPSTPLFTIKHHLHTTKAMELVQCAITLAEARGAAVAATVVDSAGQEIAAARANQAGFATLEGSRRKAYTAINLGMSSADVEKLVRENIALRALGDISGLLPLQGAVLIKDGEILLGALGVGGASGAVDEQCALEAIKQVLRST